jgi:hypothetical protein
LDGQRFDMFAKAMSKGVSRRTVWRSAIGAAAELLAIDFRRTHAQEVFGLGTPVPVCPPGTFDCGGQCVDNTTHDANCVECPYSCGDPFNSPVGSICVRGQCVCPEGSCAEYHESPKAGIAYSICTETPWTEEFCGDCNTSCSAGEVCILFRGCTAKSGGEETPIPGDNQSTPTPVPAGQAGVNELPATGAGSRDQTPLDKRIPLLGAGAAIGAAAVAWLRGRRAETEDA